MKTIHPILSGLLALIVAWLLWQSTLHPPAFKMFMIALIGGTTLLGSIAGFFITLQRLTNDGQENMGMFLVIYFLMIVVAISAYFLASKMGFFGYELATSGCTYGIGWLLIALGVSPSK